MVTSPSLWSGSVAFQFVICVVVCMRTRLSTTSDTQSLKKFVRMLKRKVDGIKFSQRYPV